MGMGTGTGYKQHYNNISDSIGLLISILVRYPEVGTINFDPVSQEIKFTFIFSKAIDDDEYASFEKNIKLSIDTYNQLESRITKVIKIEHKVYDDFTMLEINRDVTSISHEEISLIIELVESKFKNNLVVEKNDYFLEEDLIMQEELIEHMLENLKSSKQEKNLIAFREEGRVLVFNK